MEVLSSKFRSPPPKPPRRRYSDQLTVSEIDSYSSDAKKSLNTHKLNIIDDHFNERNDKKCDSLPLNWISDLSSAHKVENFLENSFLKRMPKISLAQLKDTSCQNSLSTTCLSPKSNILFSKEITETECSLKDDLEYTSHTEEKYLKFTTSSSNDICRNNFNGSHNEIESKTTQKETETNLFSIEYHRRHHSDPLFLSSEKPKFNKLQNSIPKYQASSDALLNRCNILVNSLNVPNEISETRCLQEEIKHLKEINNKLWQHLCSVQASFDKSRKHLDENIGALSISDLLSSLYNTQKAKDAAMEDRMKIILDERDAAVQDLQDLVQVIARSFKDNVAGEKLLDSEIKKLLKEIETTYEPSKLLKQQRLLLTHLYHSKESKHDHTMHELKVTALERDRLKKMVQSLEKESKTLQLCHEIWNSDNKHWENNLLNIVCQVIQQRDSAIFQKNSVQNYESLSLRTSIENLCSFESLKKDSKAVKKFENSQKGFLKHSLPSSQQGDGICIETTSADIGLLNGKVLILGKTLELEIEKREKAEEKCVKLERLIAVLQRKLNGQNVGISV